MKSTVETLSPTRVRLAIEVPFDELEPSLQKAYREIGAQVNIPGFRKGKVPAAVIDQRVGRETILTEAVQEASPSRSGPRSSSTRCGCSAGPRWRSPSSPTGSRCASPPRWTSGRRSRCPTWPPSRSTVDPVVVGDEEIDDRRSDGLRQRFATLKTVERPAGERRLRPDRPGRDRRRRRGARAVPTTNLSHEVGSNQLLPGLDDALVGMSAGDAGYVHQPAGRRRLRRPGRRGRGHRPHASRSGSCRRSTTTSPSWPASSTRWTSCGPTWPAARPGEEDGAALLGPGQGARGAGRGGRRPGARGRGPRPGRPASKQAMVDQLERMGASLADYLGSAGRRPRRSSRPTWPRRPRPGSARSCCWTRSPTSEELSVTEDEYRHEVVHRAQRAGMSPQQYYDQMVRAGVEASVFADIRRGKALSAILEAVSIKDTDGRRGLGGRAAGGRPRPRRSRRPRGS